MSKRNWDKARRRDERQEDWRYRKLGAMTDKRARFHRAKQAELREAARRRRELEAGQSDPPRTPRQHVQPPSGAL